MTATPSVMKSPGGDTIRQAGYSFWSGHGDGRSPWGIAIARMQVSALLAASGNGVMELDLTDLAQFHVSY